MKRGDGMRGAIRIVLAVALVVAAFFAGRWSRDGRQDAMASAATGIGVVANRASPRRDANADGVDAIPSPGTARIPSPGPKPLTPGDAPARANAERLMGADGGTTRDLLALAKDEPKDAQARRLEALIAQSILRHGGSRTSLRLGPPHCTRSVCVMRGIANGQTQDPRSDWQRLSGMVMNEPWFRESFDDMGGFVGGGGHDTVYITLYIRCAQDDCLYGSK